MRKVFDIFLQLWGYINLTTHLFNIIINLNKLYWSYSTIQDIDVCWTVCCDKKSIKIKIFKVNEPYFKSMLTSSKLHIYFTFILLQQTTATGGNLLITLYMCQLFGVWGSRKIARVVFRIILVLCSYCNICVSCFGKVTRIPYSLVLIFFYISL